MLIHIGYHKTATSWLQNNLFNNKEMGFTSPYDSSTLIRVLTYPHPLDFEVNECKKQLAKLLFDLKVNAVTPVLSLEDLSGNPHLGGFNNTEFANRLAMVFPNAKVLIVIREQKNIILSNYKQYIKRGGPCSLKSLLNPPQKWKGRAPWFDLDNFKYHRLANYYCQLFGDSNILVLPYELFVTDPPCFINRILDFCSIKKAQDTTSKLPFDTSINPSLSAFSVEIKRQLNRLIGSRSRINPSGVFPIEQLDSRITRFLFKLDLVFPNPINPSMEKKLIHLINDKVGGSYQDSNFILSEKYQLNLKHYDYDVGLD